MKRKSKHSPLVDGTRPPAVVQKVPVVITAGQRDLLLEFQRQHFQAINGLPRNRRVAETAQMFLAMACALPPEIMRGLVRYLVRYGQAEGFDMHWLLDQMAIGARAEWKGDFSGSHGLRPRGAAAGAKFEGLDPDQLLAQWRRDMDDEEKLEMIETLKQVAAGLEADLEGGSR